MSGTLLQTSSGSITMASGGAAVNPIGYGYYPPEGSRAVSTQYMWTSSITAYGEDLSQLVARGVETSIQSVYIDNSANTGMVQIVVAGTGQVLTCQAGYQGIAPILFTGAPYFSISAMTVVSGTPSVGVTRLIFLNVPCMTASFWSAGANIVGGTYFGHSLTELSTGQSEALSINSFGDLHVDTEINIPSYSASAYGASPNPAQDVFTISGSSTKLIKIRYLEFSAKDIPFVAIVKRGALNTGGTFASVAAVPHDSNDTAATATVKLYSVSPTSSSNLGAINTLYAAAGNVIQIIPNNLKAYTLRNANESICFNFNGDTEGLGAAFSVSWTEE